MVEPLDEKFVEEMREKLSEQWSEFERVRKKEEHDARIVSRMKDERNGLN
jgi:CRISPR/Cas system endoribonuclease Cas6 (RAMP superfamily)